MLDFTSALYLGLNHPTWALRPWKQISLGKPAILGLTRQVHTVEKKLSALQGFERSILGPSTLHLFRDLFDLLATESPIIYVDASAYPISRWGIERAAIMGTPVRTFLHHNPDNLESTIRRNAFLGRRAVVVTDGFCPGCRKSAPLVDYAEIVRKVNGTLVIDDTQALGILGRESNQSRPFGSGGGGSMQWHNLSYPDIVSVSSLAKGFGVPIAALSSNAGFVRRFAANSDTRVHSSPPSIAEIHAAEHALKINREKGDALRQQLAERVHRFRKQLNISELYSVGSVFPVQLLKVSRPFAIPVHQRLRQRCVMTVLQTTCADRGPCITFIITARHKPEQIDKATRIFMKTVADFNDQNHCNITRAVR